MTILSTERTQFEQALAALLASYGFDGSGGTGDGSATILPERLSLINYTKVKLDEIWPEAEGLQFSIEGDINVSDPYNLMINALLDESAKRVLLLCPIQYLSPVKSDKTATPDAVDAKIGIIELPDNFVRFVILKMADWKRAVSEAITTIDPRYKSQANIYTRGGTVKPVAVMSHRQVSTATKRVIEYYSVNTSHTIDYLYYIQETAAQDLQINLIDALTWMCAGMVLQISERADLAKLAFEQVQLSFQNL